MPHASDIAIYSRHFINVSTVQLACKIKQAYLLMQFRKHVTHLYCLYSRTGDTRLRTNISRQFHAHAFCNIDFIALYKP